VSLGQGKTKSVALSFPASELRRWDVPTKAYVIDPGVYELRVGASSTDIRQTVTIHVGL
jgi:beta-glucosidase